MFLEIQPDIPNVETPAHTVDPSALDRKAFGYWLSGMTDGEGSFHYYRAKDGQPHIRFRIRLRADDLPVLEAIQEYWEGIGSIYGEPARDQGTHISAPCYGFEVYCTQKKREELVVIKHFEEFPLLSKKALAFQVWKQMVYVFHEKGPGAEELDALGKQLSSIQGYSGKKGADVGSQWEQAMVKAKRPNVQQRLGQHAQGGGN